jgi:hypothetical protein
VREGLIDYIQKEHPGALPRVRAELGDAARATPAPPGNPRAQGGATEA